MPNDYFRFKQFTVQQDQCAMKVSTDACVFGAWAPFLKNTKTILDIGAGTGLLSLMLAQRFPEAVVTALEIDPEAAEQAADNVRNSLFAEKIAVQCQDIRTYKTQQTFEAIISNPPFFQRSLKGPDAKRNDARHTGNLPFEVLVQQVSRLLHPEGHFAVLLPATEWEEFHFLATGVDLYLHQRLLIAPLSGKPANRALLYYGRQKAESLQHENETLYETYGTFTERIAELMQPFYLAL